MSIASEITRLYDAKGDIIQAITDKGVVVPSGAKLDDMAALIESISGGGGGVGVPYLKNIMPLNGIQVIDKNGYIGGIFTDPTNPSSIYYKNFAIAIPGADYSNEGLGRVTFGDIPVTIGGHTYRTVTINGVTWLAENLDYKFSGCVIGPSGSPESPAAWYYDNDEATYGVNGNKYGLLYNWYAVNFLNNNRSTLCPGWHVPTTSEWDALATAVGGNSIAGTRLKSSTGWSSGNGTDDFGFAAFPTGRRSLGSFGNLGSATNFWTANEYSSANAYFRFFTTNAATDSSDYFKTSAYSVRLVKDVP